MRNLIRSPITWMVGAEVLVVGALIVVAWQVIASAGRPADNPAAVLAPGATDNASSPLPQLPQLNPIPMRGPIPGLNVDPMFWRQRLSQLNADQTYLEQLEWRIVHSAEDAARHYLETVVLPSIQRAERAGGSALA